MKKSLKKLTGIVMIGVLALGALTGCGSQKASAAKDITIGVCAGPYGDMVKKRSRLLWRKRDTKYR